MCFGSYVETLFYIEKRVVQSNLQGIMSTFSCVDKIPKGNSYVKMVYQLDPAGIC